MGGKRGTIEELFWRKVIVRGEDECWGWSGSLARNGYGSVSKNGRSHYAHRLSWEIHNGESPGVSIVCHHCDNRSCVNPRHLFLGTKRDNTRDMQRKGRGKLFRPGQDSPSAKLNADQVRLIRSGAFSGMSQRAIADQFGVSSSNIGCIMRGESWKETQT